MKKIFIVLQLVIMQFSINANAKKVVKVGDEAATDYFRQRKSNSRTVSSVSSTGDRYLALLFGTFTNDKVYDWGDESNEKDIGDLTFGVTYRIGEWTSSMDLLFRAEFMAYELKEGRPVKLSIMPIIAFPDARSRFPLYFGAGIGPGVYLKQIDDESDLSLDYQLLMGARFFDVWDSIGLIFETGLKNHVHLLTDGQAKGTYFSVGTVFDF